MTGAMLIAIAAAYAGMLFALARWAERRGGPGARAWGWTYPMALAVYCTSWTFFGAVGSAYTDGWSFLPIYLGPLLVYALGGRFLTRLVTAARAEGATSISDFIGARYRKSRGVAALVTVLALLGIIPYLALQLRSIGTSYMRLADGNPATITAVTAVILAGFAMLFGTRRFDAASRSDGVMFAVAVESLVKLVAFLIVGMFAVLLLAASPPAALEAGWAGLSDRFSPSRIDADFFIVILISACAIICLPRQFYVGAIGAHDAGEPMRSRWRFITYLLIIAATVVPITLAALALPGLHGGSGDLIIIDMPLSLDRRIIATIVFIGGFSASTAMVVVETIALATMVSNDLVAPVLLRSRRWAQRPDIGGTMLGVRRLTIIALMAVAFGFAQSVPPGAQLASIGLIAFAAMAQLAPAMVLGVIRGDRDPAAAMAGLIAGGLCWMHTLLLPAVAPQGWSMMFAGGPFDPQALLGIDGLSPVAHGTVWSLGLNLLAYSAFAARRLRRPRITIAFADRTSALRVGDRAALIALVARFVGDERAATLAALPDPLTGLADPRIDRATARAAERLIASVVGAPSARALIGSALSGAHLSVSDVTRLLDQSGQSLQFSRDLLAATLENIEPGVSVVDRDLTLVAWNSRYLDLFDYPSGLVYVGAPVASLIRHNALRGECGDGDVEGHVERRLAHMRRGQRHSFERIRPDGRTLKTVGGPMPDGGYVMCFTDVTAEAQARAALETARAELEARVAERTAALSAANRALEQATADKTRFLAAASHDLLQPLHAARLFSAALDRAIAPGERPLLNQIDQSITAAERLLRTLLDISKLDAGGVEPVLEPVALRPLLVELVDTFQPLAAEHGLRLRLGPGSASVRTDRVLLRSIVQNFLSNAIRYTPSGGVLVGVRRCGADAMIVVHDTGPGIPAHEQERIFREFERIAPRDEAGLGLGLAIVERTARLLGARLSLCSAPGRGSRFALSLPRIAAAPALAPPPASPVQHRPSGGRPLRLLVVDDDPGVCAAMEALIRSLGDSPLVHGHAPPAGIMCDAALLDLDLGAGMDGIALGRTLRRHQPDLPVAIISASQSRNTANRARRHGFTLMPKPVDMAVFIAWLDMVRQERTPI